MTSNHYLLITNDGYDFNGSTEPAFNILQRRIEEKAFPIYRTTRHKKDLKIGDTVFLYVAGHRINAGKVLYQAKISDCRKPKDTESYDVSELGDIEFLCCLDNIIKLNPIVLKDVLIKEKLIDANNKKWGAYLMGGVKSLPINLFSKYIV